MQHAQFERLLKLSKRTGDRLIVTGTDGEEPVVILPLLEYEGMVDAMTFFRSQGEAAEDTDDKTWSHEDPEQGGIHHATLSETRGDAEEDFDPIALEKQVMAAMAGEEPEMVPVEPPLAVSSPLLREESPEDVQSVRKPISRKESAGDDGGEERFYLEPV